MNKKVLYTFIALTLIVFLTACGKETKKTADPNAAFNIECIAAKENGTGIDTDTVVTYSFDDNQYATGYVVTTTQKFNDKSVYQEYKKAQKETVEGNSEGDISYELKSDDKKMTLEFTMIIKMNAKNATTDEEKKSLKASTILKNNKKQKATCKVSGIKESEIK